MQHAARITQGKCWKSVDLFCTSRLYSPDLAPAYYYFFRSHQNALIGKVFSNLNQVQELGENYFTSNPAEFYSKGTEEMPYKWYQVNANNGE